MTGIRKGSKAVHHNWFPLALLLWSRRAEEASRRDAPTLTAARLWRTRWSTQALRARHWTGLGHVTTRPPIAGQVMEAPIDWLKPRSRAPPSDAHSPGVT